LTSGPIGTSAVSFFSAGVRLAGDLYQPNGRRPPRGWPVAVVAHGFGGIKAFSVGSVATALAQRGVLALTFDYRGFGESLGDRGRLFPAEQVEDVLAAVTWLLERKDTNPESMTVFGVSFGGAVAIDAAARDARVRLVVTAATIADGRRWLRDLRRYWEWHAFMKRIEADRAARVLTGKSESIDPEEVMIRDPASLRHNKVLRSENPRWSFQLTLESVDAILDFCPASVVERIAPRPIFLVGVEEDTLTPFDHTLELFERAREPKRLMRLSGVPHHAIYERKTLERVADSVVEYLTELGLAPPSDARTARVSHTIAGATSTRARIGRGSVRGIKS
jgi:fermentation-respiration switch protein FrsA (DUF1100 family)